MNRLIVLGAVAITAAFGLAGPARADTDQPWVSYHHGRLVYRTDDRGNRIPDFSYAGYAGGAAPIPHVRTRAEIAPTGTADDTATIQAAIDRVSALPLDRQGFRGAVQLEPGNYQIAGTLNIDASGVVLRGAGDATKLIAHGTARTLIQVGQSGSPSQEGTAHAITDDYVPVGARTFTVADPGGLEPGDAVIVQRPFEANWIHAIGMDNIPPRPDGTPSTPWPPGPGLLFQRTITAIHGHRVTVDVPLTNALEKQYAASTVWKYTFAGRIDHVGVESLDADGTEFAQDPNYQYFNSVFVNVNAATDSWVRNTSAANFGQPYIAGSGALRVTMTDVAAPDIAVPQTISAQPAAWQISGQQVLVQNCTSSGSNYHAWITQAAVPGPNVYSNCTAINTGSRKLDAGPHQRWATGVLFDHDTMDSTGQLLIVNRTWQGSGQGWAAANSVMWNSTAGTYEVDSPPTARNWAIGCTGNDQVSTDQPPGTVQSPGVPVLPTSLYQAQLRDRGISK
jgi:hypothetical protein